MDEFKMSLYSRAIELSQGSVQTVGEDRKYYITLEQLEYLLMHPNE